MDVSDYLRECLQGLHKTTQSKDYQLRNRQQRKNTMNNFRRDKRTTLMYQKRQISDNITPICTPDAKNASINSVNKTRDKTMPSSTNKPNKRLEMLAKWKAEKQQRISQIKSKSKPVFKVCHAPDQVSLSNINEIKGKPIKKNPTPLKSNIASSGHVFKPPSNIKPLFMHKGKTTAATSNEEKTEQSRRKLDFRDMTKLSLKTNKVLKSPQRVTRSNKTGNVQQKSNLNNLKMVNQSKSVENLSDEKRRTNLRETRNATGRPKSVERLSNERKTANTRETRKRVVKNKSIETTHENKSNTNIGEIRAKTVNTESIELKGTATNKCPKSPKKISPTKTKRQKKKVVVIDEKTPSEKTKKKLPKEIRKSTPYNAKGWTVESNEQDSEESYIVEPQQDEAASDLIDFTTPEKSSPKKEAQQEPDLLYISPFVTISRGKTSARKEYKIRNSTGDVSSALFNDDISQGTSPKTGAEYFRRKLNREINRIEEKCKEWQSIRDSEDIPSEAHDMIDVAIGQSKLLISKKFEQFRGLIQQCKNCEYEEKPITCEDLHGFWDMIYMQVEDLDKRFNNLEKIKSNNWEEILPEKKTTAQVKRPRGRPPAKKQVASVLKGMIKAARKKNGNNLTVSDSNEQKTFDGGYFAVQSPVKNTPVKKTPSKSGRKSLRLSVLTNEAQKRISSPGITMMKITQSIKSGDGITPSKSILKTDGSRSAKKSVLFKEDISHERSRTKSLTHSVLFQDIELENDMNVTNTGTPIRKSTRLKKI